MQGKIVAISNQKGGVAKTTTTVSLASALALMKMRVLVIDLDPQCNATVSSGFSLNESMHSVGDILVGKEQVGNAVLTTRYGYDLIASNHQLTVAETQLSNIENREFRLKNCLDAIKNAYHFILIDCPPSLNILTLNALVASDGVLIPVQCEYLALEGLSKLLKTIKALSQELRLQLSIVGVLRTMYDGRNLLSRQVSSQLEKTFGDLMFDSIIPRNIRLAEAPSHGAPILAYDKKSQGAAAYLSLAFEFAKRLECLLLEEDYA